MNKNRFAAALCAALLAVTPALAGNPLKNYVKNQLEPENGVYPMNHLLGAFGHKALEVLVKGIDGNSSIDTYHRLRAIESFLPASYQTQSAIKDNGLLGFVRKVECCENLEQFLRVLESENNWMIDREGNVIHLVQVVKKTQSVNGNNVTLETVIQYTIDIDRHTITAEFEDTGKLLMKKLEKHFADSREVLEKLGPQSAAFEFGRCRESFIGNLEAAAANKLDTFAWQLEAGDFDAVLDELLKNAGANHRKMDDGSERVTSDIIVDGIKCAEAIVLDRKNNTAKVTVSCAPLRVARTVTPGNLKEAKDRIAAAVAREAEAKAAAARAEHEQKIAELQQKAGAGDVDAFKQLADISLAANDQAGALAWYRKGVEQGHVQLAGEAGDKLLTGQGFAKDPEKALEWYRLAAEKGDHKCALAAAKRFRSGDGFAADIDKALEWYSLAAEKGSADAAREVAEMYRYGKDVEKNEETALNWYRRYVELQGKVYEATVRAEQEREFAFWVEETKKKGYGEEEARKLVAEGQQRKKQQKPGRSLFGRMPATSEPAATARKIADNLLNGVGFAKDENKALEWYETAYRYGDESVIDMCWHIGDTYRSGDRFRKLQPDIPKAVKWYQKLADLGDEEAAKKVKHLRKITPKSVFKDEKEKPQQDPNKTPQPWDKCLADADTYLERREAIMIKRTLNVEGDPEAPYAGRKTPIAKVVVEQTQFIFDASNKAVASYKEALLLLASAKAAAAAESEQSAIAAQTADVKQKLTSVLDEDIAFAKQLVVEMEQYKVHVSGYTSSISEMKRRDQDIEAAKKLVKSKEKNKAEALEFAEDPIKAKSSQKKAEPKAPSKGSGKSTNKGKSRGKR